MDPPSMAGVGTLATAAGAVAGTAGIPAGVDPTRVGLTVVGFSPPWLGMGSPHSTLGPCDVSSGGLNERPPAGRTYSDLPSPVPGQTGPGSGSGSGPKPGSAGSSPGNQGTSPLSVAWLGTVLPQPRARWAQSSALEFHQSAQLHRRELWLLFHHSAPRRVPQRAAPASEPSSPPVAMAPPASARPTAPVALAPASSVPRPSLPSPLPRPAAMRTPVAAYRRARGSRSQASSVSVIL
jgi:hypothetical protein